MPDFRQMTLIDRTTSAETISGVVLSSEADLARVAWTIAQGGDLAQLTVPESNLVKGLAPSDRNLDVRGLLELVRAGADPLGEAFTQLRSPDCRRSLGATYTPREIVSSMVTWLADRACPARVVDPGTGSARFLLAAGRAFPRASLVGVEIDPLAGLLARANLTAAGFDQRSRIVIDDYRTADLDDSTGVTAYLGNPPYVRHHQIETSWKQWLSRTAKGLGLEANGLAGLHVHFLLATALRVRPGDVGSFVTSAEWLDVNYGRLLRELVSTVLGGLSIHVVDPKANPFGQAAATAAVTCFEVGTSDPSIGMKLVADANGLGALNGGRKFGREQLGNTSRWSPLLNGAPRAREGHVELGELCRVHRGAVTGANAVWITEADDPALPSSVLFPSITRARELFEARTGTIDNARGLRAVVDLPADLTMFDDDDRRLIERFLRAAEKRSVRAGYIARNRNPWWSVGLRSPAPILATYMARRPPAFVRNAAAVRNVNVAHGIYPRESMTPRELDALAAALRAAAPEAVGRTYAGGLLKFEPSEMARILVPSPATLGEDLLA